MNCYNAMMDISAVVEGIITRICFAELCKDLCIVTQCMPVCFMHANSQTAICQLGVESCCVINWHAYGGYGVLKAVLSENTSLLQPCMNVMSCMALLRCLLSMLQYHIA